VGDLVNWLICLRYWRGLKDEVWYQKARTRLDYVHSAELFAIRESLIDNLHAW